MYSVSKQEFHILIILILLEANRTFNKSWRAATEQYNYSKPLLTMQVFSTQYF